MPDRTMLDAFSDYDKNRQAHLPTELNDLENVLIYNFRNTQPNNTITIKYLKGLTEINWGDGVIETVNDTDGTQTYSHIYTDAKEYIIALKGVTRIGSNGGINGNSNISILSVIFPKSLEYLAYFAGVDSRTVKKIIFNSTSYTLSYLTFGILNIQELDLSGAVSLDGQNIRYSTVGTLILGENCTRLGNIICEGSEIGKIIIKALEPPDINSTTFNDAACPIYVPLQSLQAYKTATNWNAYADRIVAIPDTNYVPKKEEIDLTNLGTITSTAIVSGSFYRNNIAVSNGISVGDIVFVQMSNDAVYPAINNNATQIVIYNGSDLSSLSVTKVWKIKV